MTERPILITGASGYLGKLVAAALLATTKVDLVLPVRPSHGTDAIKKMVTDEASFFQGSEEASWNDRLRVTSLPADATGNGIAAALAEHDAAEVVHCAGCLDYFDEKQLWQVNVELTRSLLAAAADQSVRRFIYMSSAFSSGYVDGPVRETIHEEPIRDPTIYTKTKRQAERLVAQSGLNALILRPSIVIGHSRTGRYTGKQYGLYQLWSGVERLLCSTWEPEFHAVAPETPVNLVHQDAFQRAFLAARDRLPGGSVLNVVSAHSSSPTLRQLWDLWVNEIFTPQKTCYYKRLEDVPLGEIPLRQRSLMALASTNIEIATHNWRFETDGLENLELDGAFQNATLDTVRICHDLFVGSSAKVQRFTHKRRSARSGAEPAR